MIQTNVCSDIVNLYLKKLGGEFKTIRSDDGCFLMTPFYRPDGEGVELEIETMSDGNVLIHDMGDTLGYLFVNGLTLSRPMIDRAKRISMAYGVSVESSTLVIEASPESAGEALHEMIQAVLEVTSLIQRRRPTSTRRLRFEKDVEIFIGKHSGVSYKADYNITGAHENHKFRFYVNSGRNFLVQPISASKESIAHSLAERWAYRFNDVLKESDHYSPIAVVDDGIDTSPSRPIWTPNALAPIQEYAIPWSENDRFAELLTGTSI